MRNVAEFFKALARELEREYLRFSRQNSRAWQRVVSGSISMSLWLLAAIIAMSWYGLARVRVDRYIYWIFLTYFLYSEAVWAAADARADLKNGIAEQILAARANITAVLLQRLFVDSLIWSFVDSIILTAIFAAIFGGIPRPAQPLLFAAALPPLLLFSLTAGAAAIHVMYAVETTWVVGLMLQLVVPLLGGIIPPTALPRGLSEALLYSPFQYIIAPAIYAGTGSWPLAPSLVLLPDYIISITLFIIVLKIDKYINHLYLLSK